MVGVRERRLSWEESQRHYNALSEIEDKHIPDYLSDKITKSQKKKAEAKIYNEWNQYKRSQGIVEKLGGFYKAIFTD